MLIMKRVMVIWNNNFLCENLKNHCLMKRYVYLQRKIGNKNISFTPTTQNMAYGYRTDILCSGHLPYKRSTTLPVAPDGCAALCCPASLASPLVTRHALRGHLYPWCKVCAAAALQMKWIDSVTGLE